MVVAGSNRKNAEQWIEAAYARFAAEGLTGVRVEVIARDLGTTKGSFYWHFADRRALVEAVMKRWESIETDSAIEIANAGGSPQKRLALLYRAVGSTSGRRRGEARLYVEAIAEGVGEYVARVSNRRVDYIASVLESTGMPVAEARRRGLISLSTAIGLDQLAVATDADVIGDGAEELGRSALAMMLG